MYYIILEMKKPSAINFKIIADGFLNGAYGIRTHGLNNANVARSQLRQCPADTKYNIFFKKSKDTF